MLSLLRDDKLYIAFVAEFSRGKSELINAIFFAHFGTRVLPSSAGRTTMCPTELLYEAGTEPVLKLLPIETRKTGTAIAEYRNFPEEWQNVPLDLHSSEAMALALAHIAEVKHVPREEAQTLGLHIAEDETEFGMRIADDGLVEIPRWRHAVINLPHPLLEHGLVILDTPGLNALGAEPELTLNLLPNAQAVLYVLAADTGVTKTDIQVWHDHIGSRQESTGRGRLVVLNKIDGLWDGLRPEDEVEHEIARQVRETAETLGHAGSQCLSGVGAEGTARQGQERRRAHRAQPHRGARARARRGTHPGAARDRARHHRRRHGRDHQDAARHPGATAPRRVRAHGGTLRPQRPQHGGHRAHDAKGARRQGGV